MNNQFKTSKVRYLYTNCSVHNAIQTHRIFETRCFFARQLSEINPYSTSNTKHFIHLTMAINKISQSIKVYMNILKRNSVSTYYDSLNLLIVEL